MKKRFSDYGREWLDTLVVAISVAMAFRAYFYEPFNIPTGSMQPTLWGNHAVREVEKEGGGGGAESDGFLTGTLRWVWSGERRVEYKAPVSGHLAYAQRNDGYADVWVVTRSGSGRKVCKLPVDAVRDLGPAGARIYAKGETIWKGTVTTGDFIFVNRWAWNFRKPKDGDVMIFSTTGIDALPQGTHYIKRMKATPGETYVLEHPPKGPDGRVIEGLPKAVKMGPDEYFACGDNFDNSYDSRYWGVVPGRQLRGLGSVVFWPFNGWRIIR